MAQLISPQVKVLTKDGEIEVHISIDLNLNLTTNGFIAESSVKSKPSIDDEPEKLIPSFSSGNKVKFGK